MPHIVAISSSKGGVAKTTTCMSLGACLAELGHRTLIIELDTRLRKSPAAGEPITPYAPRTRASQQYRQLAHEFPARLQCI